MGAFELKGIRILAGMDKAQANALFKYGEILECAPGDIIVKQNEAADALFFLLQGRAGAYVTDHGGGEVHLRTIEQGAHFGEIGLLEAGIRTATVKALSPCTLFRMDADSFKQLLQSPELAAPFLHGLSRSLAIRLADITSRYADERSLKDFLARHTWI